MATVFTPTADGAQVLHRYLRPGERLLWSGGPDPAVLFSPKDIFLIPFSLMWGGFAIVWEGTVVASGDGALFMLWGIPFVLIGLYMIAGRFFYKRRRKQKTVYGLTEERALVAVGDSSLSDTPTKYVPASIRRARDGRHVSVSFGGSGGPGRYYANTGMDFFDWRGSGDVAFFDVADVEGMLRALDRARARS
jgi:hypothetical protein